MMFTILEMLFNIDIHHVSCHNMWHRLDLKEQNLEYKVSSKDFMQPIIHCIMRDIVTILIRCQINLLFARLQLQVLWPCYFVILGTLTFFYLCCVAELCFGNNVILQGGIHHYILRIDSDFQPLKITIIWNISFLKQCKLFGWWILLKAKSYSNMQIHSI